MTNQDERFVVDGARTAPRRRSPPDPARHAGHARGQRRRSTAVRSWTRGSRVPAGFGLAVIAGLADDVRVAVDELRGERPDELAVAAAAT